MPASRKALAKDGWSSRDLDLVGASEAFAAQALAVNRELGRDPSIVNVNGGAIAIDHPIGASGARILNSLFFEMKRRGAKKGMVYSKDWCVVPVPVPAATIAEVTGLADRRIRRALVDRTRGQRARTNLAAMVHVLAPETFL